MVTTILSIFTKYSRITKTNTTTNIAITAPMKAVIRIHFGLEQFETRGLGPYSSRLPSMIKTVVPGSDRRPSMV